MSEYDKALATLKEIKDVYFDVGGEIKKEDQENFKKENEGKAIRVYESFMQLFDDIKDDKDILEIVCKEFNEKVNLSDLDDKKRNSIVKELINFYGFSDPSQVQCKDRSNCGKFAVLDYMYSNIFASGSVGGNRLTDMFFPNLTVRDLVHILYLEKLSSDKQDELIEKLSSSFKSVGKELDEDARKILRLCPRYLFSVLGEMQTELSNEAMRLGTKDRKGFALNKALVNKKAIMSSIADSLSVLYKAAKKTDELFGTNYSDSAISHTISKTRAAKELPGGVRMDMILTDICKPASEKSYAEDLETLINRALPSDINSDEAVGILAAHMSKFEPDSINFFRQLRSVFYDHVISVYKDQVSDIDTENNLKIFSGEYEAHLRQGNELKFVNDILKDKENKFPDVYKDIARDINVFDDKLMPVVKVQILNTIFFKDGDMQDKVDCLADLFEILSETVPARSYIIRSDKDLGRMSTAINEKRTYQLLVDLVSNQVFRELIKDNDFRSNLRDIIKIAGSGDVVESENKFKSIARLLADANTKLNNRYESIENKRKFLSKEIKLKIDKFKNKNYETNKMGKIAKDISDIPQPARSELIEQIKKVVLFQGNKNGKEFTEADIDYFVGRIFNKCFKRRDIGEFVENDGGMHLSIDAMIEIERRVVKDSRERIRSKNGSVLFDSVTERFSQWLNSKTRIKNYFRRNRESITQGYADEKVNEQQLRNSGLEELGKSEDSVGNDLQNQVEQKKSNYKLSKHVGESVSKNKIADMSFKNKGSEVSGEFESAHEVVVADKLAKLLSVVSSNVDRNSEIGDRFVRYLKTAGYKVTRDGSNIGINLNEKTLDDVLTDINEFVENNDLKIYNDIKKNSVDCSSGFDMDMFLVSDEAPKEKLALLLALKDKLDLQEYVDVINELLENWNMKSDKFEDLNAAETYMQAIKELNLQSQVAHLKGFYSKMSSFNSNDFTNSDTIDKYVANELFDRNVFSPEMGKEINNIFDSGITDRSRIKCKLDKVSGDKETKTSKKTDKLRKKKHKKREPKSKSELGTKS